MSRLEMHRLAPHAHDRRIAAASTALVVLAAACLVVAPISAEEAEGRPAASLSALDFMVGSWRGGHEAVTLEELWTAPRGGVMLGLNRTVTPRGTQFEFLRIEASAGEGGQTDIVYWASPGGKEPTPFPLVEVGETRAVFANPKHDFPQRIIYTRAGDTLHARVEAGEGDAVRGFDLEWQLAAQLD